MNITKGQSAKKEHLQVVKIHGTRTACKRRLSYGANNYEYFAHLVVNYPEVCCQKCINEFNKLTKKQ